MSSHPMVIAPFVAPFVALFAGFAMCVPLSAQPDHFTTSPQGYEYAEGGSDSRDLLGTQPRLRFQQIDATNTRPLNDRDRIAFRRDGWLFDDPAYGPRVIDLEIVMAEANINGLSTTFAANYQANMAVVVARKNVNFADWTLAPQLPPAPTTNTIFLDQRWSYQGKIATGRDFLWEVRVHGNSQAGQDYPFDLDYVVPNATFGAVTPTRSTNVNLSLGCAAGSRVHTLVPAILNDGSSFALHVASFDGPLAAPHVLLLDVQDVGLRLPILCNPLHALALAAPIGTSSGAYALVSAQLSLAYMPWLIGTDFYLQVAAPDATRPGLPLSLTNGVRATLPDDPARPVVGRLWALDPTAATATVGPVAGGVILYTNHS